MLKILISLLIILPCFARLCLTDIKSKELETACILLLLPCAFFYKTSFVLRLIGAFAPFLFIKLFGFGDIILFAALGFIFGAEDLITIIAASSVLSGLWALYLMAVKHASKDTKIAYAPFICIGVMIVIVNKIILLI